MLPVLIWTIRKRNLRVELLSHIFQNRLSLKRVIGQHCYLPCICFLELVYFSSTDLLPNLNKCFYFLTYELQYCSITSKRQKIFFGLFSILPLSELLFMCVLFVLVDTLIDSTMKLEQTKSLKREKSKFNFLRTSSGQPIFYCSETYF